MGKANDPLQRILHLQLLNTSNTVESDIPVFDPSKFFIKRKIQSPPLQIGSQMPNVSIEEMLYHLAVSSPISITGIRIQSNIKGKELCKKITFCAKSVVGDMMKVPVIVREKEGQVQKGIADIDFSDPIYYGKFSSFMIDILFPGELLNIYFFVENVSWYKNV